MTRRAAGVALLVVALLAVVVVARIGGTRVAGRAIAPPGLSAPTVGDCVAGFADPAHAAPTAETSQVPTTSASPSAPRPLPDVGVVDEAGVTFSGCAGGHLGEVIAYRRMAQQWQADADRSADIDWCRSVAGDYRAHLQWRVSDAAGGLWSPSTGQRFTAVLSAPFVDPQEPRWSACLVLPPAGEKYAGSYVRSLAFGPAPAPFGRCFTDAPAELPASCAEPHTGQEFGISSGPPATARAGVASCRELIGAMTGMSDPTGGGSLRTEVVGSTATGSSSCRLAAVGNRRLTGTLIGIGDAPVPLT